MRPMKSFILLIAFFACEEPEELDFAPVTETEQKKKTKLYYTMQEITQELESLGEFEYPEEVDLEDPQEIGDRTKEQQGPPLTISVPIGGEPLATCYYRMDASLSKRATSYEWTFVPIDAVSVVVGLDEVQTLTIPDSSPPETRQHVVINEVDGTIYSTETVISTEPVIWVRALGPGQYNLRLKSINSEGEHEITLKGFDARPVPGGFDYVANSIGCVP